MKKREDSNEIVASSPSFLVKITNHFIFCFFNNIIKTLCDNFQFTIIFLSIVSSKNTLKPRKTVVQKLNLWRKHHPR